MTFPESLNVLLNSSANSAFLSSVNYSTGQIVFSLLFTFIFALFIYAIYKKSYQGVVFSKNFGLTLMVVSLIAAVIVMAISGNLALSLGMIGALSIVRFRSAIKDPRDIAFLFWAITSGIVSGVFIYKLAIIANLFIGVMILLFSRHASVRQSFLFVIIGNNMNYAQCEQILKTSCLYYKLRLQTVMPNGEELHVEVKMKKKSDPMAAVQELMQNLQKNIPGVSKITSVSQEENLL